MPPVRRSTLIGPADWTGHAPPAGRHTDDRVQLRGDLGRDRLRWRRALQRPATRQDGQRHRGQRMRARFLLQLGGASEDIQPLERGIILEARRQGSKECPLAVTPRICAVLSGSNSTRCGAQRSSHESARTRAGTRDAGCRAPAATALTHRLSGLRARASRGAVWCGLSRLQYPTNSVSIEWRWCSAIASWPIDRECQRRRHGSCRMSAGERTAGSGQPHSWKGDISSNHERAACRSHETGHGRL
jgi:hypothetical protein